MNAPATTTDPAIALFLERYAKAMGSPEFPECDRDLAIRALTTYASEFHALGAHDLQGALHMAVLGTRGVLEELVADVVHGEPLSECVEILHFITILFGLSAAVRMLHRCAATVPARDASPPPRPPEVFTPDPEAAP